MFDLSVFKGIRFARAGILDIEMFTNKSAQGCPLSSLSLHPLSIHYAWPLARFQHFYRVCSSSSLARTAKPEFFTKLTYRHPTYCCLASLASVIDGTKLCTSRPRTRSEGSWLVLPYSPHLLGLKRELETLHAKFIPLNYALIIPRISWAFSGRNLLQHVQHDMGSTLK